MSCNLLQYVSAEKCGFSKDIFSNNTLCLTTGAPSVSLPLVCDVAELSACVARTSGSALLSKLSVKNLSRFPRHWQ